MSSVIVPRKSRKLIADGTSKGLANIGDNTDWLPGARVWLRSSAVASLECIVVEQVEGTTVRLRARAAAVMGGASDISTYLVADTAMLSMEKQDVAVQAPYVAYKRVP